MTGNAKLTPSSIRAASHVSHVRWFSAPWQQFLFTLLSDAPDTGADVLPGHWLGGEDDPGAQPVTAEDAVTIKHTIKH